MCLVSLLYHNMSLVSKTMVVVTGDIEVKYRRINKNEIQCPVLRFSLFLILPPLEPKAQVFPGVVRASSSALLTSGEPRTGQLEGLEVVLRPHFRVSNLQ